MENSSSRHQFLKHRPYRALVYVLLYTAMVRVAETAKTNDFNHKRHFLNPSAGGASRLCRSVCLKVNEECTSSCYPPQGTAHTTFSTTWIRDGGSFNVKKDDSEKYKCINRCLDQNSDSYLIPDSCQQDETEEEEPTSAGATKQTRVKESEEEEEIIELTTLTTEERCKFKAYRNSTVCEFEDDAPDIAKKVFDANKPKLTLCMKGSVMSGQRGLYTSTTRKRFLSQQELLRSMSELESSFTRKRSVQNPTNIPLRRKRTKRSLESKKALKRARRNTKKNSQVTRFPDGKKELCITEHKVESPSRAIHRATGSIVDIYFYAGYSQWFEMGKCKHKHPTVNVELEGFDLHCGMTMTAHKAYVIIDPTRTKDVHKFKDCGIIKTKKSNRNYQICHDWVYLESHCKLFFS